MTRDSKRKIAEKYSVSTELLSRAFSAIPGQAQTFSKSWTQYPRGVSPVFAARANGARIWDVDGNEFIDWPMALGPVLLGHNYPAVNNAVERQLKDGIAFSLPTKGELELSEKLINWFPYAERVRFGKNGSDATSGAVRAARAYTNREIVLCCGYHGWQDWYIGTTTRARGVPDSTKKLTIPFPYDDLNTLKQILNENKDNVAAIILEPLGFIEPSAGFLQNVRTLANKHRAVLIFDECWTGFRIHSQGAYGKYDVTPDLACFGKALGNGIPISAIVGRADILDVLNEAFFSFTFGGDMLGISAAMAFLNTYETHPVLEHVNNIGRKLMDGCQDLIRINSLEKHLKIVGYPARHAFYFHGNGTEALLVKSLLQQEALAGGILSTGWHAPSFSHTESDVSVTLNVYDKVFATLSNAISNRSVEDKLLGNPVKPVFRE